MPYAASVVSRDYQDEFELLSVYLNRGVIPYSEGGGLVHKPSEDLSNYQHVVPGDIVLNNQQAWRGSVGVSRHFGNVSPAYIVLRPITDWHPGYLNYLLRSPFIVTQLEVASRGVGDIQRQISRPWMREVLFPMPDFDEQRRIADFLDRETAKIDALIAKQEQLITTLDERRGAVISRAVTRGLVDDRPLRESGVEWLGQIPSDWDVKPLKSLCSITNSGVWGEEPDESLTDTTMPVATTAQITRDGAFIHSQMQVRSLSPLELKVGSLLKGDIVVVKSSGSADNIISGKAGYVRDTDSFCFGNFLMRLRVKASNDSRYLFYFLISNLTRQRIERMVSTTTYPNLKVGEYVSAMIPVPSDEEQRRIADFLDRETGEILESTVQANRIKELLLERRQALISAAVTGKLEVSDGYS